MDMAFDIDLGELISGHHVVARGIELGATIPVTRWMAQADEQHEERLQVGPPEAGLGITVTRRTLTREDLEVVGARKLEPELHYEFVPGIEAAEEEEKGTFFWYWTLEASDDLGTQYSDNNGGGKAPSEGGAATHAIRDIGGHIPPEAKRLRLRFFPPPDWTPPEPWRGQLLVDLVNRRVIE